MNHRHLLPEEIDLLVDNEEGFGIAPLRAHLEQCPECRAEVETQRQMVTQLESLPHFAPSPIFAYKVLKSVQVFEPWHVTALDTARRFVPETRAGRVLVGGAGALVATAMTVATIWIATNVDAALLLFNVLVAKARGMMVDAGTSIATTFIGQGTSLGEGPVLLSIVVAVFIATLIASAVGLRALASASRRRRE